MTENEEEVINLLLAQVSHSDTQAPLVQSSSTVSPTALTCKLAAQENEILTEQEELISLEQVLRRQIATEKEEIERLRAEIADIQRWDQTALSWLSHGINVSPVWPLPSRQQGRSETEEYSSDSESESEDEEELQMILEDLQKQNEELEVRKKKGG